MKNIALVMFGGSLGALSRYTCTLLAVKLFGVKFPWGTLIVNLAGCFLIGFSYALAERNELMNASMQLFFVTGYLGALTTFSTFAMETVSSVKAKTHLVSAANVFANNVLGISLVFLGVWFERVC